MPPHHSLKCRHGPQRLTALGRANNLQTPESHCPSALQGPKAENSEDLLRRDVAQEAPHVKRDLIALGAAGALCTIVAGGHGRP